MHHVRHLILVLGDQLDLDAAAFDEFDAAQDAVWMAEAHEESTHVWSSKQLRKVVSHTDIERQIMGELRDTLNWEDVARRFVPETEKLYSWWSYRAKDWDAADKGRRLDHIWVTPNLSQHVTQYNVLREARGLERPSDHAPLFIDMA